MLSLLLYFQAAGTGPEQPGEALLSEQIPEASFDVSRTADGTHVISIAGELDIASAPGLAARTAGLRGNVIVDLGELTFIDSSGITALVNASRELGNTGGKLVIASPPPHTRRVFEIVHLDDVVPVVESLEAALARLSLDGGAA
jgi:anti-anti-sigma factor